MYFNSEEVYHIYNRGNKKDIIFYSDEDYLTFLKKINNNIKPVCDILCWALMPNHFHLMVHANTRSISKRISGLVEIQELSYRIGILLSNYSQTINKKRGTTGSLFQQKTKAKELSISRHPSGDPTTRNDYIINCMHYIHQNPWKAGLVKRIEDWKYSSFPDFCGFRNGGLCNKELLLELTGYAPKSFYEDSYQVIQDDFDDTN